MGSLHAQAVLEVKNLLQGSLDLVTKAPLPKGYRALQRPLKVFGVFDMGARVEALAKAIKS
jgi:hypothetical protein